MLFEFLIGLAVLLIQWGLGMIGVTTNFPLGVITLLFGISFLFHAIWRFGKSKGWSSRKYFLILILPSCLIVFMITPQFFEKYKEWKTPKPEDNKSGTTIIAPGSTFSIGNREIVDYIEGTKVRRATLRDVFPFGYVVFWLKNGRLIYEPFSSGKLEWKTDWSKTEIVPDFASERVEWKISDLEVIFEAQIIVLVTNSLFVDRVPMTPELVIYKLKYFSGFINQPEMFVSTLSRDQRSPIFVLGFRIDDTKPKAQ